MFAIRKDIPEKAHAEELLRRLFGLKITDDIETNYLAVYFEDMMSLCGIMGGDMLENILPDWIFLLQRWKDKKLKEFYLFYFKNRNARIDITGHVISGLQVFFQKKD
jgi:hypothetical protein